MLKKFLLLFIFGLFFYGSAQTEVKTLVLLGEETNIPIEDATVTVLKSKHNYLSNANGAVDLEINGVSTIQIKHPSYVDITIKSTFLKEKKNVVYLKSNINNLEEIIITKKHPQKILLSLIQNSKKRLTIPSRLKIYSREFYKLNGRYAYYNDGLMNFQLINKANKTKVVVLVEQNRSIELAKIDNYLDLVGYNLNDIMENYYNFKYLNPILESVARKEYDFIIKTYNKNKEYNIIIASPIEDSKGLMDDFSIIYDPKEKLIIEVSSFLSPTVLSKLKERTRNGTKNIYKSFFKTIYKVQNNDYFLLSSKEEIGFEKIEKDIKNEIEVRNYFLTTNFSNTNFTYKEEEVFKEKTLYNKKDIILSDYWNQSGLTPLEDEQFILRSIEKLD